ncbi:hypothetical protein, partial [Dickeya zeae]|uniref:hypothetical protein n=1 Tax=Dickeya zeae TaxID=204042 RepID=UPI00057666DC
MTCKITLDEDSFKKLEEMIKEKYPSVDEVTYLKLPIYPFKVQDFIEKLVISSWHTLKHFYKKDSRDFIKKTRYSLNKFGGRIYDFERYKNNAHDEWGVVIYNIFYFLIEYSFWDDIPLPDYINDYTLGELNKIYNTDFDVSFYGMRERVINKIVSYNFDSDKLARLYGLIERNEKSTSELAKQNNEIKKSKNDVIELKDALSEIEDNFQGKLLTRSFFMMKEDIKVQILKARVNYRG